MLLRGNRQARGPQPPGFPWVPLIISLFLVAVVVTVVATVFVTVRDEFYPAPEDEFPLPTGWRIRFDDLDCGSGGCSTRYYVVSTPQPLGEPVRAYAAAIRRLGWDVSQREARSSTKYFVGRNGALIVKFEPASSDFAKGIVPSSVREPASVLVLYWECGRGSLACD